MTISLLKLMMRPGTLFIKRQYSAPSSTFSKVAFWQPEIKRWLPDIKYWSPEKRDTFCNTTWIFERIKNGCPTIAIEFQVHATSQGLIPLEPAWVKSRQIIKRTEHKWYLIQMSIFIFKTLTTRKTRIACHMIAELRSPNWWLSLQF